MSGDWRISASSGQLVRHPLQNSIRLYQPFSILIILLQVNNIFQHSPCYRLKKSLPTDTWIREDPG